MHAFFQEFSESRNVGDGAITVGIIWVVIGLLEDCRGLSDLQPVREGHLCKGGVDDLCPGGGEQGGVGIF